MAMNPRLRTALAGFGLLLFLGVYAALAASVGGLLASAPVWLQIGYYALAGLAWVIPLRPVFRWLSREDGPQAKPREPIP